MQILEGEVAAKRDSGLSEIGQQTPIQFAFATVDGTKIKAIHSLFLCRDFFNDVLFWNARGEGGTCCGFKYDPTKNPLDVEGATIILADLDRFNAEQMTADEYVRSATQLFDTLEEDMDDTFIRTTFTKVVTKNSQKAVLIVGDPVWKQAGPLISVFTCFLRLACRKGRDWKKNPWHKNDATETPNPSWDYIKQNYGHSDKVMEERGFSKVIKTFTDASNEAQYIQGAGIAETLKLYQSAPKWYGKVEYKAGWKADSSIATVHNFGFRGFISESQNKRGGGATGFSPKMLQMFRDLPTPQL